MVFVLLKYIWSCSTYMFLLRVVKRKSGGKRRWWARKLSQKLSSDLCESFETTYISAFIHFQSRILTCQSRLLTPYCRRHLMVWGCQSSQRLPIVYICIHIHFNSSHFSNLKKKKHSSLEIWRALKLGFILRVPVFTHFCSGFQCGNSSYEGHFAICSLYALLSSYISWQSNNRIEVANQGVLKYGLCYNRLSGYDTVEF